MAEGHSVPGSRGGEAVLGVGSAHEGLMDSVALPGVGWCVPGEAAAQLAVRRKGVSMTCSWCLLC